MDLYSLYLHVPFCRHRCSYCDFNTFAGQERWIPAYVEAICQEITAVSQAASRAVSRSEDGALPVHTVFFGGGTPSLLRVEQIKTILDTLRREFSFQDAVEISLEANPGTVSQDYLQKLRALGVDRLSFGMQSAHPDDLRLLERQHDFFDVVRAVRWAREAGFDNLSLDLIFGLPEQTLERWKDTVKRAVDMGPDHLSLYALTIEHGTPLQKRWARGMIPLVDDDLAADMYEYTMQALPEAGFEQYEISNFARRAPSGALKSCRHNLQYWRNQPYLGFGAGAHGYAAGNRTMNIGGIRPFLERCAETNPVDFPAGPATRRLIPIDAQTAMQETMMVGLRLTQEGVSEAAFLDRFGLPMQQIFGEEINRLERLRLLEWVEENDRRLRLTERGVMLGNQVFSQFVG